MKADFPTPEFKHTPIDGFITQYAVLLVSVRDREYFCFGNAVIIAKHIALTARHVFEEYIKQLDGTDGRVVPGIQKFNLQAIQFVKNGSGEIEGRYWRVNRFFAGEPGLTDIAFLELAPTHEAQVSEMLPALSLRLDPPPVGGKIAAFGYHSTKVLRTGESEVEFGVNPYTATGTVKEIHNAGRDGYLLPFPSFRTDARFDPGMSGGPVFYDGALCGLICSNLPPTKANDSHVSYVASLWPTMMIMVGFRRDSSSANDEFCTAYELAKLGFIRVLDLDQMHILPQANGRITGHFHSRSETPA